MSLASKNIPLIGEDDVVVLYQNNLSYDDMDGEENILLFDGSNIVGYVKVWKDSEMEGREYIILNHTIVYLDTLKKI
jgi:hypothetical protein